MYSRSLSPTGVTTRWLSGCTAHFLGHRTCRVCLRCMACYLRMISHFCGSSARAQGEASSSGYVGAREYVVTPVFANVHVHRRGTAPFDGLPPQLLQTRAHESTSDRCFRLVEELRCHELRRRRSLVKSVERGHRFRRLLHRPAQPPKKYTDMYMIMRRFTRKGEPGCSSDHLSCPGVTEQRCSFDLVLFVWLPMHSAMFVCVHVYVFTCAQYM